MSNVRLPSGWVFNSPCGPVHIPKFGLGSGWGPVTLSGGAAFRFPIVRWFDVRACMFAVPLAGGGAIGGVPFAHLWTSVFISISSVRVLPKFGGGPISGTAVVPSLAGSKDMGSRFAARFLLCGWFSTRVRAGESGC